jgi:RimJ/RimL family protein N-acetyltransferase
MLGHWHLRNYGPWIVVERASAEIIGRIGVWNPEDGPGLELGWVIRRSRWNQGFATEAAQAALRWIWQHVGEDHVISIIDAENYASCRVAEKIGERFERVQVVNGTKAKVYAVSRS